MAYLAVAPLVLAKDQAGRIHYHYEGINPVIPWLSDDQAEHFLSEGLVEEADDDELDEADPLARPRNTALKDVWVAHVVAKTAATEKPVTAEEADKLSKQELISLYGGE
jgi:hypothetical protein